MTAAGNHKRE